MPVRNPQQPQESSQPIPEPRPRLCGDQRPRSPLEKNFPVGIRKLGSWLPLQNVGSPWNSASFSGLLSSRLPVTRDCEKFPLCEKHGGPATSPRPSFPLDRLPLSWRNGLRIRPRLGRELATTVVCVSEPSAGLPLCRPRPVLKRSISAPEIERCASVAQRRPWITTVPLNTKTPYSSIPGESGHLQPETRM